MLGPTILAKVIGHRGAAAHAPENTLAGFRKAAALGCKWVEFDVRLTRDNKLVIFHDEKLNRTTDGKGRVRDATLMDIAGLDAGAWFSKEFAGERVPTLAQAIPVLTEAGLRANIEIKADPGDAEKAALALSQELSLHWADTAQSPLVSSFDHAALGTFAKLAPKIPTGFLMREMFRGWRKKFDQIGCATLHVGERGLTEKEVRDLKNTGVPLAAYTVNDPDKAKTLFQWGISAVFSDAPDRIFRVI